MEKFDLHMSGRCQTSLTTAGNLRHGKDRRATENCVSTGWYHLEQQPRAWRGIVAGTADIEEEKMDLREPISYI